MGGSPHALGRAPSAIRRSASDGNVRCAADTFLPLRYCHARPKSIRKLPFHPYFVSRKRCPIPEDPEEE
jgi:hypothetical protein